MSFKEQVNSRVGKLDSRLCVGIDPRPERIDGDINSFLDRVIEQVNNVAVAVKPNIAFFESMGSEGYKILEEFLTRIPDSIPVILDVKRSDIPETQKYYAKAYFERWNVDAVTLNPYTGYDSIKPYLRYEDRGIYLLGITSNDGAKDVQTAEGNFPGAFKRILRMVRKDETDALLGLVMGLTHLHKDLSISLKGIPLLIPGLGAQGGNIDLIRSLKGNTSILVNSSRTILYGSEKSSYDNIQDRAKEYRDKINDGLRG